MKIAAIIPYLRNKQILRIILAVLILVTTALFIRDYFLLTRGPAEFQAKLICQKCRTVKVFEIPKLSEAHCPQCGADMAFLYKCDDCQYEFPYKPVLNTNDEQRCPICHSGNTHAAPLNKK